MNAALKIAPTQFISIYVAFAESCPGQMLMKTNIWSHIGGGALCFKGAICENFAEN